MMLDGVISSLNCDIFENDSVGVKVPLRELPGARMLWVNEAAVQLDPAFLACDKNMVRYEAHLIKSCAVEISESERAQAFGWADRYGGDGISFNGGSGRSVSTAGYYVKGVGRTPLLSQTTDKLHGSGRVPLDECIREAIFSEVARCEFPWSAVPTLAIIDVTGDQLLETRSAHNEGPQALLVRPNFLRPAHFLRAPLFLAAHRSRQEEDVVRVRFMMDALSDALDGTTSSEFVSCIMQRWAEQIAYGFVHRLSQGGGSPSNLALDGRLVDFGGASALPSWANITTTFYNSTISEFNILKRSLGAFVSHVNRYSSREGMSIHDGDSIFSTVVISYNRRLIFEVLKLCGFDDRGANHIIDSVDPNILGKAVNRAIQYYAKENSNWKFTQGPMVRPWVFSDVWLVDPPFFLRPLNAVILAASSTSARKDMMARCVFLASNRTELFFHNLSDRVNTELLNSSGEPFSVKVSTLINKLTIQCKRNEASSEF